MTTTGSSTRRYWRRWLALALIAVVLLVSGGWWAIDRFLFATDPAFVGTWRCRIDGTTADLLKYELSADDTGVIRYSHPSTGATTGTSTSHTWWVRGSKLVVRHPGLAVGPRWDVLGMRRHMDEEFTLTPDGPERFHYTGAVVTARRGAASGTTGTLTRVIAGP